MDSQKNDLPKIKVCGMRDPQNIQEVGTLNPDFMGFIFYDKSRRNVKDVLDPETVKGLNPSIKKVGVFVNADFDELSKLVKMYSFDAVQLHGDESVQYCIQCRALDVEIIKVFGVSESFDFAQLIPYEGKVDYFLFDTKSDQRGGTGQTFDWSVLKNYYSKTPLILSGGIGPENIEEVLMLDSIDIYAIDVNSKFEKEPALKDVGLLRKQLMNKIVIR